MKNLYTSVAQQLREHDIVFIDLDVGQFEVLENYTPIDLPAVFVSFNTTWTTKAKGVQYGDVELTLLVVSEMILDTHEGSPEQEHALKHFDIMQKVYEALQDFNADCLLKSLERRSSEALILTGYLAATRLTFHAVYSDRSILEDVEQSKVPQELVLKKEV